ncbi:hypothetical protein [Pseudomonas syringae]|uniref:hypothetical protein n=1 Tax=Pseudomonas syringae TaxID=317 RepID=UPI001C37D5A9|nr:hypothetical protein [Pseudomonas syringae]
MEGRVKPSNLNDLILQLIGSFVLGNVRCECHLPATFLALSLYLRGKSNFSPAIFAGLFADNLPFFLQTDTAVGLPAVQA